MLMDASIGKKQAGVLIGAFLCGCLHHLLFYNHAWGLSFPIFMIVFYVFFYWSVKEQVEIRFNAPMMLLIPIVLLSLTYVTFANETFSVLNALAIPCLVLVHTIWTMRKPAIRWYDGSMVLAILEQIFVHTMRHVPTPVIAIYRGISQKMKVDRSKQVWKVLAGIVISLPIVLVVGALLASADTMFDRLLSQLPRLLGDLNMGESIFRAIWIIFMASAIFAYVWGLLFPLVRKVRNAQDPIAHWELEGQPTSHTGSGLPLEPAFEAPAAPDPLTSPAPYAPKKIRMDATVITTFLLILNAVYVLFAFIQFSYFFGGGLASLPDEMTYADYARRGFAELVVVTVINFTVLMATLHGTDRSSRLMDRFLRVLLAVLIGCTGVMLCSAFMRMAMYERAYGFSETRLLVDVFIVFLSVLFVIALVKLWNDSLKLMKPYAIIAIVAYVIVNYMQVEGIVASNNVKRFETTGSIDTDYLGSLSFDAVPYLIELKLNHPELDGADKALQRMKRRLPLPGETSWVSFNLSEWRAARALQNIPLTEER
ncbi:DUF4153 domain-containing protein [Paenibacillus agricola]|uniref:DUF4173 domain-containing protein n=1 Tax=Paenibacillus agricola TaxID=2716264 RepID=A0ABX0JAZ4_9BACL|nr:DUF4173 domain-containing protein [Paenibacillus agricola]NHN31948.1 DUF4173 domain-containing protein [Paenibacillus agricola]